MLSPVVSPRLMLLLAYTVFWNCALAYTVRLSVLLSPTFTLFENVVFAVTVSVSLAASPMFTLPSAFTLPFAATFMYIELFASTHSWRLPLCVTMPFTRSTTSAPSSAVNWPLPVTSIMVFVSVSLPVMVPPLLRR